MSSINGGNAVGNSITGGTQARVTSLVAQKIKTGLIYTPIVGDATDVTKNITTLYFADGTNQSTAAVNGAANPAGNVYGAIQYRNADGTALDADDEFYYDQPNKHYKPDRYGGHDHAWPR
jgi:hypothetical protein